MSRKVIKKKQPKQHPPKQIAIFDRYGRHVGFLPYPKIETYRRETPKVGRNAPCPCGSGLKHKRCCI